MKQQLTAMILTALVAGSLSACAKSPEATSQVTGVQTDEVASQPLASTPSDKPVTELQMTDTQKGSGAEATTGKMISVHYTGTLYPKGAKFDSSLDRGQPFSFRLGQGQVIEGWDKGFAGMKVGGKRTLVIPAQMAYGPQGVPGAIPPNATLKFDVELLDVE